MAGTSYKHIERDIRSKIRSGEWHKGTLLPSRRELAKHYNVAGVTVQRATACLLEDGTLRSHPRKGTFVAGDNAVQLDYPVAADSGLQETGTKRLVLGILAELPPHRSPSTDQSYFEAGVAVQAIEGAFSDRGMTTRFQNLLQPNDERLQVDDAIEILAGEQVDGIAIVFSDEPKKARRAFAASRRTGIPVVYVSSRELEAPLPHVFFDNRDAGFQATQHLLDQGCREIVMITAFSEDWMEDRARGIRDAASAAEVPEGSLGFWPERPEPAGWDGVVGYDENKRITQSTALDYARSFFRNGQRPEGIIAANDHVAFAVIEAAGEIGLRLGRDYLLIGFDDVPDARMVNLSTMRPPLESMGHEAANMLQETIQGRLKRQQVKLRSRLVTRASTVRISTLTSESRRPLLAQAR